jgi:hypothetical protein
VDSIKVLHIDTVFCCKNSCTACTLKFRSLFDAILKFEMEIKHPTLYCEDAADEVFELIHYQNSIALRRMVSFTSIARSQILFTNPLVISTVTLCV